MERRDPGGVWLDGGQLIGSDPPQPGDAVGAAPRLEVVKPGELGRVAGDDDLATPLKRHAALLAELVHLASTVDAQPGLERAGLVVDAGMHHTRVVAGLVGSEPRLALEEGDP
jgi:hypothetical protein